MSALGNRSQSSARRGDYIWQYEYYDYEEPVSFDGLRAHRCEDADRLNMGLSLVPVTHLLLCFIIILAQF